MTFEQLVQRKRGAIIGAAVADAASVGFHWLYDQQRILDLAPVAPEFRQQSTTDYAGVPGYFAHANRAFGDFSQYGEQMMVILRSLVANKGSYSKSAYEAEFGECFGYGGSYVGYIDRPTRDTLNNIAIAEASAISRAEALPFGDDDALKHKLITKVLSNVKRANSLQLSESELRDSIEESVRLTDNQDHLVDHALQILQELKLISGYHGTGDRQLPAISKLPPLVAVYAGAESLDTVVASAVKVTHDNDHSVNAGQAVARVLEGAIVDGNITNSISAARLSSDPEIADFFDMATQGQAETTQAATAKWGMACELRLGLPSIIHNLSTSISFTDAVRKNIYSGGDSCGRSILIGAVMGACYGVGGDKGIPQEWVDRLIQKESMLSLVDSISVSAD